MGGHVILFPFMAQGHIIPFIALAEHLHRWRPELTITIVNTPRNIQTIQSSFPDPIPTIRFRSLPFSPSDHGLPPGTESAAGLSFPQFLTLFNASESLKPHFNNLLHQIIAEDGRLPSCIISDNFLAWTVDIAEKLNVFHSILITSGVYGTAISFTLWLHLSKLPTIEAHSSVSLPDFPEVNIHWSQLPRQLFHPDDNFVSKYSSFLRRQTLHCFKSNAILLNTVKEFETTGLCMLEKLIAGVPHFPIGPLLRQPSPSLSSSLSSCVEWLNEHSPATVLYISFGSQNSINASQMMELAAGLEASNKAFIWVIRPPYGFDVAGEFKPEWLPGGFEERMRVKKQGLLVHAWAPQVQILAHESTCAFLSHCGWNSVLESLSHGVPIIGWPLGGEQFYNSMFLEEVGVCVELGRGNREGMSGTGVCKVERERVKKVVEMVMGGSEKGVEMKKKAMEISGMIRGALMEVDSVGLGSSVHGLDEFLKLVFSKLD